MAAHRRRYGDISTVLEMRARAIVAKQRRWIWGRLVSVYAGIALQ
jgi:hypothetical protein